MVVAEVGADRRTDCSIPRRLVFGDRLEPRPLLPAELANDVEAQVEHGSSYRDA
jgi:hypothetical protein